MRSVQRNHLHIQILFILWPMQSRKLIFIYFLYFFLCRLFSTSFNLEMVVVYLTFQIQCVAVFDLGKGSWIEKAKFAIFDVIELVRPSVHIWIESVICKILHFGNSRNDFVVKQTIKRLKLIYVGFVQVRDYHWKAVDGFC